MPGWLDMQKGQIFKKKSSLIQNMWKKLNAGL